LPEKNLSVLIQGDFVNATGGGEQAFHSSLIGNAMGSYSWTINKSILQDKSFNNITLFFFPVNPSASEPERIIGPTLMVTTRPPQYYQQRPTKAPETRDLYIALPCVFGFILLCVCGGAITHRKNRRVGLGNVMGRRKGYGTGKSKVQRLGLRGTNREEEIQLRDQELTAHGKYRDVPLDRDSEKARTDGPVGKAVSTDGELEFIFED